MTTLEIFTALRDMIAAIPLDAEGDPEGEKLFDAVELYPNQQLGKALQDLIVVKSRACLVVPLALRRNVVDRSGSLSVLGRKYAELALIYSDRAYFKSAQAVAFGSDNNLGLFAFDEKLEAALVGRDISPFGGIVLGDSDPITLSDSEQKSAAGRQAWLIQAFLPIDLIASSTD